MTSEDVRALIAEARGFVSGIAMDGTDARMPWRIIIDRLADALEASAVSTPPTITDADRESAFEKAWGFRNETRPVSEKWHTQGWFDRGWNAAVAALHPGGETNG